MATKKNKKQTRYKLNDYDVITLRGPRSAAGTECSFFKLSPSSKFGIKMYETLEESEDAYEAQKLAAEHGLAPGVGRKLFIRYFKTENTKRPQAMFGYETKIARKVEGGYRSKIWKDQSVDLENALCCLGIGGDFHIQNVGIIGRKLVAVDFGECSRGRRRGQSSWSPPSW